MAGNGIYDLLRRFETEWSGVADIELEDRFPTGFHLGSSVEYRSSDIIGDMLQLYGFLDFRHKKLLPKAALRCGNTRLSDATVTGIVSI
jgi:hypothetical protein